MKLYTFRISYKTRHKSMSKDSWISNESFIHIVKNNKKEAQKAALSRYNKMINRDYKKGLYERVRLDIRLEESQTVHADGFLDIYI